MCEFLCRFHQKPWERRIKLLNRLVFLMCDYSNFAFFTKLSMFFYHQGSGKDLQTKFVVLFKSFKTLFSWKTTSSGCRPPLLLDPHLADRHSLFRGGAPRPEEGEVIALLHPNGIGTGISAMDDKECDHFNVQAVSTPAVETTHNSAPPTGISGQLALSSQREPGSPGPFPGPGVFLAPSMGTE